MPLASIVIPCFSHGQFLPRAVCSALAQSEPAIEVVVVDDGSPLDPFTELGDLASDPRLTLLRQPHAGLAAARNHGLLNTSAPLVLFLDADDWIAPSHIETLSQALAGDDHVWFAYSDVTEIFEDAAPSPLSPEPYSVARSRAVTSGNILGSLLCGGYFPVHSALVRRSALQRIGGFCPDLDSNEDYDLWLRLAAEGGHALFIDQPLAFYRRHGANMSLDRGRMESSRVLALSRLFRAYPDAAASALSALASASSNIFQANLILQNQLVHTQSQLERTTSHLSDAHAGALKVYQDSQAWIAELERARGWHRDESARWQSTSETQAAFIQQQQTQIQTLNSELEAAATWHKDESARWQDSAAKQSEYCRDLQSRIQKLESELAISHKDGGTQIETLGASAPLSGPADPAGPNKNL